MLLAQQGLCASVWRLLSKTDKLLKLALGFHSYPPVARNTVWSGLSPRDSSAPAAGSEHASFRQGPRVSTERGPKLLSSEGSPLAAVAQALPGLREETPAEARGPGSELGRGCSRLGHQEGPLVTLLVTLGGRLQGGVLALSPLSFLVLINSMSTKAIPWVCPRPRGLS